MKTNEWIVSPKKLKENQMKAIEKEEQEKESKHEFRMQMFYMSVLAVMFITLILFVPLD